MGCADRGNGGEVTGRAQLACLHTIVLQPAVHTIICSIQLTIEVYLINFLTMLHECSVTLLCRPTQALVNKRRTELTAQQQRRAELENQLHREQEQNVSKPVQHRMVYVQN